MRPFNYSKIEEEKWDSEILGLIAAIYKFAGKQELYLKQRPDELEKLVEIAKIQSTEASNAIEGIVTTNTRIKQLVEEKTTPKNRDEEEIAGYRDVLNIIHECFDTIPITQNYILQLHKILCSHMNNPLAGRTKNVQNYISATYPDGHTEVLFTPLAPFETPEALDRICEEYNRVIGNYEVEPLLAIPIFIHDFLCIHPFNEGNGRMSRLLTTLLLYRSGFYVGKYISLEAKIAKNKDLYYEALGHSQDGWHEGEEDAVPFIKYLLGTILAAYKDFEDRFKIVEEKLPAIEMVRKATQQRIGKFNKQDIRELCPALSVSSIEGSLRKLVAEGELRREGRGKSTFYVRLKLRRDMILCHDKYIIIVTKKQPRQLIGAKARLGQQMDSLDIMDKLYKKKEFLNSFVELVDIYEQEQTDGRFLEHIKFRFSAYFGDRETQELCWDNESTVETVVLLQRKNM